MNTVGRWLHQTILKVFLIRRTDALTAAILLFIIGAFAIFLRTKLRFPMNMPGRQGVMVMFLFMIGRAASTRNIAGIYSGMGASLMLLFPFIGTKDPWLPLIYLVMGISLDYFIYLSRRIRRFSAYLIYTLIGGAVYMIIPLSRFCINLLTGLTYTEFIKHPIPVPFITHFIFGALGSMLGSALIIQNIKRQGYK